MIVFLTFEKFRFNNDDFIILQSLVHSFVQAFNHSFLQISLMCLVLGLNITRLQYLEYSIEQNKVSPRFHGAKRGQYDLEDNIKKWGNLFIAMSLNVE